MGLETSEDEMADAKFAAKCKQLVMYYSVVGREEWWWVMDDSIDAIGAQLEKQGCCILDGFLTNEQVRLGTLVQELGRPVKDLKKVTSRSKAMAACYPGHGARYVKHVDNDENHPLCAIAPEDADEATLKGEPKDAKLKAKAQEKTKGAPKPAASAASAPEDAVEASSKGKAASAPEDGDEVPSEGKAITAPEAADEVTSKGKPKDAKAMAKAKGKPAARGKASAKAKSKPEPAAGAGEVTLNPAI